MLANRNGIGRRGIVAGAVCMAAAPAVRAQRQTNGVALVIGNSKYKWEASLPNVPRDATDIARRFEQLGLKTELLRDLGRAALRGAIDKFAEASRGAQLAAVYFAGHGAFGGSVSYVVPVDADLSDPSATKTLISVPSIGTAMKDAAARLLVMDSCRNNPADGWRQLEAMGQARGDLLNRISSAASRPNTLFLFSTAPGSIALDGPPADNSPFAAALLRQLAGQRVDLQSLPAKLRRELLLATECRQFAWYSSTYAAPFPLVGPAITYAAPAYDPSRIVELPKAYAFAEESGLTLPPGLVAYRPSADSPDAQKMKIGSYKHEILADKGFKVPAIGIVMSVPTRESAELVWSFKRWGGAGGTRWRNIAATHTDDKVAWLHINGSWRNEYLWRDRNSGTFTSTPSTTAGPTGDRVVVSPFTRLD